MYDGGHQHNMVSILAGQTEATAYFPNALMGSGGNRPSEVIADNFAPWQTEDGRQIVANPSDFTG